MPKIPIKLAQDVTEAQKLLNEWFSNPARVFVRYGIAEKEEDVETKVTVKTKGRASVSAEGGTAPPPSGAIEGRISGPSIPIFQAKDCSCSCACSPLFEWELQQEREY